MFNPAVADCRLQGTANSPSSPVFYYYKSNDRFCQEKSNKNTLNIVLQKIVFEKIGKFLSIYFFLCLYKKSQFDYLDKKSENDANLSMQRLFLDS